MNGSKRASMQYRPFTIDEFKKFAGDVGDIITYRFKKFENDNIRCLITAISENLHKNGNTTYLITLGHINFTLDDLYNDCELKLDNKYTPFGVKYNDHNSV